MRERPVFKDISANIFKLHITLQVSMAIRTRIYSMLLSHVLKCDTAWLHLLMTDIWEVLVAVVTQRSYELLRENLMQLEF